MKILTLIPLLVVSLTSVPKTKTKASSATFDKLMISPFYLSQDSQIVIKTSKSYLEFIVYIKNDLYTSQAIVSDTVSAGTYTYVYNNAYTRSNNTVFVRYRTTEGGSFYQTKSLERNIVKGQVEYIRNNQPILADQTIASYSSIGMWMPTIVTYNFENFNGLYVPDYFHKIRLADFKISLDQNLHPFFSCKPRLVIKNLNGAFDDACGQGEYASFDLVAKEKDDYYYFALKNTFYVHPRTLKMSSTKKSGYVATKHIFFPRNEMHNQQLYESRIVLVDFGIDKDSLFYDFEIRAQKNILGDCSNSKYCVTRESL